MLQSPVTTPDGRAEKVWPRLAGTALLLIAAGIHFYEYFGEDVPYLQVLFVLSGLGLVAGAALLIAKAPRLGWLVGGLSAVLTLGAYIYSRFAGLPADASDVGNWLQPDGVESLIVEILLILVALWAITGDHGLKLSHAREEVRAIVPGVSGPEVTSDVGS